MENNNGKSECSLKIPRCIYIAFWGLMLLYVMFSELDVLPVAYLALDVQSAYAMNMLCVILTLAGTFISLRLFAVNKIKQEIQNAPCSITKWNIIRTIILGVCALINIMSYYALCNDTTSLYCFLITITGFVFCWPKQEEVASK